MPTDIPEPSLPEPFGVEVPPDRWQRCFEAILADSPDLTVFDGVRDARSTLLKPSRFHKQSGTVIIDELTPDIASREVGSGRRFLFRAQFYEGGLHHRLSFHGSFLRKVKFEGYPAWQVKLIPPLKQVTNLFIAYPSADKPMFLEIPIEGAPPGLRLVEVGLERMRAFVPNATRLVPKSQHIKGVRVDFVDLGDVLLDGKLEAHGSDNLQLTPDKPAHQVAQVIEQYLHSEYRERPPELSQSPAAEEAADPARPLILVADDDAAMRLVISHVLRKLKYRVIEAVDGNQTLEMIRTHSPDLILLDVDMPGRTGIEVLMELRTQRHGIRAPVVMVTAVGDSATVRQAIGYDIDGYLVKPFDEASLMQRVRQALGGESTPPPTK